MNQSSMHQQLRFMAGSPESSVTSEDTWSVFRKKYAVEKRNDLSQAMYALILVFGFATLTHDFHTYPPRVVAMMGLVACKFVQEGQKGFCVCMASFLKVSTSVCSSPCLALADLLYMRRP
jgi:hypothetical protein